MLDIINIDVHLVRIPSTKNNSKIIYLFIYMRNIITCITEKPDIISSPISFIHILLEPC